MLDNHYVPEGYGILPNVNIFGYEVSTYLIFVGLALLVGITWFLLTIPNNEKISH